MDSLLTKIVSSLTGDKAAGAQPGKDYWVDDAKVKACYECETPFSVFVRRHHCRICGRIFCSNCTLTSIQAPKDADQTWLRVCNYCHRMRLRDDDSSDRAQSGTAQQLLLGSVHAAEEAGNRRTDESAGDSSAGGAQRSPSHKARSGGSLSRSSASSEGALTWEVPAVLDRSFGPTAEAVAETAPSAAQPSVPGVAQATEAGPAAVAAGTPAAAAAVNPSSLADGGAADAAGSAGPVPSSTSASGLHPLVQLNRQECAVAAEEHMRLLLWQLLQAEEVGQADEWMPIVLRLVSESSKALLPAAAAAFGQQDPRFYVKVKRLPDMGRPSDSRVVRGVVAKKNVAHRRMRTDIQQPCVALLSGALEYQRVANRLSSFDTLLDQEREHLRLAVARIAAAKPDLLLVERSVARSAQEELLARGISLVQHTKPEMLERLGRCMGVKVVASVEELSPQMVGTCSRFKVETLPAANTQLPPPQQAGQQAASADVAVTRPASSAAGVTAEVKVESGRGPDLDPSAAATANGGASLSTAGNTLQPLAAAHVARPGVAKPVPVSAIPAAAKTLMVFDGCPLPLGCTVLLWGAPAAELTKLKRIVKFGVLAAYHQGLESAFLAEELALATAALAAPDMSRDACLFRSIARTAISSSRDATNPEHLVNNSRLLLSLSPHVVVPDALEKEQRHAAAVRLHQQHHGALARQSQQADHDTQQLTVDAAQLNLQRLTLDSEPGSPGATDVVSVNGFAAVMASAAADDAQEAPGTPDSAVFALGEQQQFEPEFTDPLRRRTLQDDDDLLSDVEDGTPGSGLAPVGVEAVPQVAPLWLQGLQLYDRQHVYLSMACRNPRRGLMCEPPAIKRIDYYCHSDLSLAAFIVAAAPHAQKKCQVTGCGDGVTCHVRTFLHAGTRITLSIATLPAGEALPGEDRGQVWMWMRPKSSRQRPGNSQAGVCRLPLSQACACMSFGMFLSLCFSAPGLEVFGTPLHSGFVRYYGLGRSVMCLHQDSIYPSSVAVPRMKVTYSLNAQLMWLKQEAAELCQESNEAFDVLESALQSHPYFKSQAAAAQVTTTPTLSPLAAAAAATAAVLLPSGTPKSSAAGNKAPSDVSGSAPAPTSAVAAADPEKAGSTTEAVEAAVDGGKGSALATQGAVQPLPASASALAPAPAAKVIPAATGAARGAPLVSLSAMLSAVRKDRSSFMDKVAEVVQRATPETPTGDGIGAHSNGGSSVMWDEQLMAGVLELNRLQRSLAISTLTWAATLQEPALFTQMLAASSSAVGSAAMAAAAAATASAVSAPGSPLAAAAAAAAAAVVAAELCEQGSGSAHGGSMFHLPPAVAAQRMGIADGSEAGDHTGGSSGVSVPIMPNAGPIAVQAVANLVASEAATTAAGGLLEGSQQVMMAVTQRAAPESTAASLTGGSGRTGSLDGSLGGVGSNSSSSRLAQHARSSSVGSPLSPRARWAAAGAAAQAGVAASIATASKLASSLGIGARGSTGSLTALAAAAAGQHDAAGPEPSMLSSSLESGSVRADKTAGQGSRAGSPSASLASSSTQSRQQQQLLHRQAASGTGSAGTTTASAAAAGDGDDGSSEDGEVSHDRFVAWMTSHEIATPETDDLSDFYPEQLPDWDDSVGVAAAGDEGAAQPAAVGLTAVAGMGPCSSTRPPTPPGTPEPGSRLENGGVAIGPHAAPAATGCVQPVSHRRTRSMEAAAAGADKVPLQQQQQQSSGGTGTPAGLAPIKTTTAPAASRSSISSTNASSGAVGLQQIARVALPGRALMPAGINDTVIPIFDAEPTSIAAYFLSSRAYQLQLNASMRQILHGEQRPGTQQGRQQQGATGNSSEGPSSGAAAAGGYQLLPTTAVPVAPAVNQHGRSISQDYTPGRGFVSLSPEELGSSTGSVDDDPLGVKLVQERPPTAAPGGDTARGGSTGVAAASANGASSTVSSSSTAPQQRQQQQQRRQGSSGVPQQPDWLALLLSPEPLHVKHAFEDDSPGMPWLRAKFSVTAYFAPQFAELRRRCIAGGEAAYITSLCRCRKWASRGGKSNAYFAKTRDDRFIVKSLSKPEKASFLEFAPAYFEHMAHAAASGKPTALAKVAGVYSITIKSQSGNPVGGQGPGGQSGPYKDGTIDVLVMENIFYDRQITRIYDLKGSERSRFNADAAANPQDAGAVHLDDNLRRANLQQPILVDQGMLRAMERALWSDTSFLAGLGVMDYSLLVGVDKEHNQLVVAIIDFIRTYTWDKQLETWVKSSGILGGNGKEPTIVSPKQYMKRFRAAISSYFTVVPDGHEVEPPLDADAG